MFNFLFGKKKKEEDEDLQLITKDLHSHFIPAIDDGSSSVEETLTMLKTFIGMGFSKVITTPHITEGYDNSPETILPGLQTIREAIQKEGLNIQIEAAAEYFLNESFFKMCQEDSKDLLSFGDRYILIETAFLNRPIILNETVKVLQSLGYNPIYAHPERYQYLQGNWDLVKKIYETGIMFQINALSIGGYYDDGARKLAERLIDNQMVHFVGSDCHKPKHAEAYKKVRESNYYKKACQLNLFNQYL